MQLGPKYGYPRIRSRSRLVAAAAQLARPFTVFAAWLVGFLLAIIASQPPSVAVLFGLALAAAQATGQTINQIADVDIDKVNKPYRPIPSGLVTVSEAWTIALVYYSLGMLFSLMLGPKMLIMYLLVCFFAVYYSLRPIRAKRRGAWTALLWQAISRGLLPPLIASYVFGASGLWPLAVLAFLWVLALQSTKDFGDVEGDRMYGVETLPVKYGAEGAVKIMKLLIAVYVVTLVALVLAGQVPVQVGLMVLLAIAALETLNVETVTENSLAWNIFYIGLGLHYLLWLV